MAKPVVIRTDLGCWVKVSLPDIWVTPVKNQGPGVNLVEEKVRPRTHTLTSLRLILGLW